MGSGGPGGPTGPGGYPGYPAGSPMGSGGPTGPTGPSGPMGGSYPGGSYPGGPGGSYPGSGPTGPTGPSAPMGAGRSPVAAGTGGSGRSPVAAGLGGSPAGAPAGSDTGGDTGSAAISIDGGGPPPSNFDSGGSAGISIDGGNPAPPSGFPGGPPMGPGGYPGFPGGYPGGPTGTPGAPGTQQPEAEAELSLKERAERAFKEGKDDLGFQYMYAYYVADTEGQKAIDLRLLPSANRPRSAVRWGIGIDYTAPNNFTSAPPTIGAQPNVDPEAGGNRQGGRGPTGAGGGPVGSGGGGAGGAGISLDGGDGFGGPPGGGYPGGGGGGEPSDARGQLLYYSGDVGSKLVERLNMRRTHEDAFYGQFLKEISFDWASAPIGGGGPGGFQGGAGRGPMGVGSGRGPTGVGSGGPPTGSPTGPGGYPGGPVGAGGGLPGGPVGTGGYPGGPTGPGGYPGGPMGAGGYPGGPGAGMGMAQRDPSTDQLLPGVIWLGKGNRQQLIKAAQERGLDALIVIETRITVNRTNDLESNLTKLVLCDVTQTETEEIVRYTTRKALQTVPVWKAKQERGDDLIEEELDNLFQQNADAQFKLGPLPEGLDGPGVKAHLEKLVADSASNPLPALAQVRYFHQTGLLTDTDLLESFEKLLGDAEKASMLAEGTMEEAEEALADWLPPKWAPSGGAVVEGGNSGAPAFR